MFKASHTKNGIQISVSLYNCLVYVPINGNEWFQLIYELPVAVNFYYYWFMRAHFSTGTLFWRWFGNDSWKSSGSSS